MYAKISNSKFLDFHGRSPNTPIPHRPRMPESPRIDCFLFGRGREVSLIFFSPIMMFYESVPIQIRCRYGFSDNRLNSAGIAQEFITISKITLEHAARKLRYHSTVRHRECGCNKIYEH